MQHWPVEYRKEFQRRIGFWLRTEAPRGSQRIIANLLEVDPRTVRSWKKAPPKKRGRKKTRVSLFAKLAIAREWDRQGFPGYRPIASALPHLCREAVQDVIRELKLRKKRRYQQKRMEVRVSVSVKHAGVMTVMDGATVKDQGGDFIVFRDRGSTSVNADKCETRSARSVDTLRVLTDLREKGRLPLVLGTDNGSPFCSEDVEGFLTNNKVIHLKSLPRVPQQNGSAENTVGDLKGLIKYGFTPIQACLALNQHRRRATLDWQTPAQAEQNNLKLYTEDERAMFYDATRTAIARAVLGMKNAKEKRKAEREAIFQTLESFSLITRTRGHRSTWTKAEEIT